MSVSFQQLKSSVILRYEELKGCGANKPGGGGFSAGNTCARGGSASSMPDEKVWVAINKIHDQVDLKDGASSRKMLRVVGFSDDKRFPDKVLEVQGKISVHTFKDATIKEVDPRTLYTEQKTFSKTNAISYVKKFSSGFEDKTPPRVVKFKDKLYLLDGNHRAIAARVLGIPLKVKIKEIVG